MDVTAIKRIIYRLFPELKGNWHLPHLAKVVALPELPTEGEESDRFTPRYAADIHLLDANLIERQDVDIFQAVPLPLSGIGSSAGILAPPTVGSIVEVAFIGGNPAQPIIRGVYPLGFALPAIKKGEIKLQTRTGVYRHIDERGNFQDVTDQLASLQCKLRDVVASQHQSHKSPKSWIGSDSENLFKIVSELTALTGQIATLCASHTHTTTSSGQPTSPTIEAGDFSGMSSDAETIKGRVDSITL